jgi:ketosteroid isomerase-like protein
VLRRDTERAVSQQNVEIVRRCIESMNRRDVAHLRELLDPEIELDLSRNIFNPDVYRGRAGIERFRSVVEDVWDDFHTVLDEVIDVGDGVVVTAVTMAGTGKESGVDVAMRVFQVWTLRGSKVVRIVGGYRNRAEALEAAGLPG